jgi:uncharacterized protein (DUF488 family)
MLTPLPSALRPAPCAPDSMPCSVCATDNGQLTTDILCYIAHMTDTLEKTTNGLYSIGHGNRSIETFMDLIQEFRINHLADVRSFPSSRRNPHFDRKNLELMLNKSAISYTWFPDLGGFRRDGLGNTSPHVAIQSPGFRNYADYMNTASFHTAANKLSQLVTSGYAACFMCAETVPHRCHRSLLADYLLVQGFEVIHILDRQRTIVHELSRLATVKNNRIIYNRS